MAKKIISAGAAKTDITPPLGSLINGDFITHYVNHVHDLLFSKALVLQNQDITLAVVIVDICIMPKDFLDDVKAEIFKRDAICPDHVLISSTHTHAAGSIEGILLGAADLPYREKLLHLIVESVHKAKQNLRPAQTSFGSVNVPEHVVCRRYYMQEGYDARNPVTGKLDKVKTNPIGAEDKIIGRVSVVDTGLNYLAIRGIDQKWIALLGNYSMHYVGDWPNGTISSDYFGSFSRQIAAKLNAGDNFIGMMSNGTSGEANIWDFLQPDRYPKDFFMKSELIGNSLAEKVCESTNNLQWETDPYLCVRYREIAVPVRKPTHEEVDNAKKIIEGAVYENFVADDEGLIKLYSREQVLLNEYPDQVMLPLQVMNIGHGIIGALPGEFFAETGLWLKEKISSSRYFTITLANGYFGYVPPTSELELGGYETWRCRSSFIDAERQIRDQLLGLTKELR